MTWNNVERICSANENVWKFVFTKPDAVAEAVLYRYPTFEERTVICCSTQSGCPVGCRFCGAGDAFVRSLSADEIISQVDRLISDTGTAKSAIKRLQVMFMSMGEPMLNYGPLAVAIRQLNKDYPQAKLLISTSGPDVDYGPLRRLSQEVATVGLQFSVHESTDAGRNALIPFRAKLSIQAIAIEGWSWWRATGRKPFFNYCAHEGNASEADADRLRHYFHPDIWECTVSVVCERDEHVAAANARQRELAQGFMVKMLARGFGVRMFDPAGQDDIGGGCGQLWFVQDWMKKNGARPSVGAGLPAVHAPSPRQRDEA